MGTYSGGITTNDNFATVNNVTGEPLSHLQLGFEQYLSNN